jgi:hypothetical protein
MSHLSRMVTNHLVEIHPIKQNECDGLSVRIAGFIYFPSAECCKGANGGPGG